MLPVRFLIQPSTALMTNDPPISSTLRTARESLFLGIDVGGTNVKLGLVDASGVVHAKDALSTPDLVTPERIFNAALAFADHELPSAEHGKFNLTGIGLAVPGVLDSQEAVLREVVNLLEWKESACGKSSANQEICRTSLSMMQIQQPTPSTH